MRMRAFVLDVEAVGAHKLGAAVAEIELRINKFLMTLPAVGEVRYMQSSSGGLVTFTVIASPSEIDPSAFAGQ